jgi:hypothetical protein
MSVKFFSFESCGIVKGGGGRGGLVNLPANQSGFEFCQNSEKFYNDKGDDGQCQLTMIKGETVLHQSHHSYFTELRWEGLLSPTLACLCPYKKKTLYESSNGCAP